MDDKKNTILLMRSLAINLPIIEEAGLGLDKLILLDVSEGQMKAAIKLLSNDQTKIISEFSKMPYIADILYNLNSTSVLYPYTNTRKGADLLRSLAVSVQVGECSGKKMNAMPIVVSEGLPKGVDLQNLFIANVDGDLSQIFLEEMIEIPPDEQVPVVIDKMSQIITEKHSSDEAAFLAAACFFYPNFKALNMEKEFEEMVGMSMKLATQNEENHDTDGLSDAFLKVLYKWQERKNFTDIVGLPNLNLSTEYNIKNVILFDENYLYMSDALFKIISSPLLQMIGVDILKSALAENGILCRSWGDTSTFTVKLGYYDARGSYKRKRMLRFNREKLNLSGELDFITICKMSGGKAYGLGKI